MNDIELAATLEAVAEAKMGKPSCNTCSKKDMCLMYFMRPLVNIKPTYVSASGCGQYEPEKEE